MTWWKKLFGIKVFDDFYRENYDDGDLESQLTVSERVLTDEVSYLRGELTEANARYERLARRFHTVSRLNSQHLPQSFENSGPVVLGKHKPLEVRRAELEKLSRERAAELKRSPEDIKKENYWKEKASVEEQNILQELSNLEDKLNGEERTHA